MESPNCDQVLGRDGDGKPARPQKKQGGTRATLFVFAMEGFENMAFVTCSVSFVTYFYGYMNFGLTKSANTFTNFMGTSYLLTLFGGFISDTYLSRFNTCVVFGCIEIVGYTILTMQAHFHSLRPQPCKGVITDRCEPASGAHAAILYSSLYLIALGTGGVKAALPSLGADQFDKTNPKDLPLLSTYFNWFIFSLATGASVGGTFVVWISSKRGWDWAFGICSISVSFAVICIFMGKSIYHNNVLRGSPLTRILQVLVATVQNWRRPVPDMNDELHEKHDKEAGLDKELMERTDQFRFLDRAAITTNLDGTSYCENPGPWRMCTVTQVEETKILLRMFPIILSTICMNICIAQFLTFSIQQAVTMDTTLAGFHIPAASLSVTPLLTMAILLPLYDRIFVPFARRLTGNRIFVPFARRLTGIPTGIRPLHRIRVGLVLSAVSMGVAGIVETRRKAVAVEHNMVDSAIGPLPMSAFWLGFQYCIIGTGNMFLSGGMTEFFYTESSPGMKSLSIAMSWCSVAFGYFGSSVVVEVVNMVSGGWLGRNNLNRDKLNYFYWLLAGLSVVNFGVYLVCASWYRYRKVDVKSLEKAEEDDNV